MTDGKPLDKNINDSTRQKIIESAVKLFAEKGYEGTSVREIANGAEANLSMISYYFGGKEELYKTVIRDFALSARDDFEAQIANYKKLEVSKENFVKMIAGIMEKVIAQRERWPYISQILEREKLCSFHHSREVYQEIFFPLANTFRETVMEAQQQGFVHKEVIPEFFFGVMMEGLKGLMIMKGCTDLMRDQNFNLPKNRKEIIDQLVLIFMKGILK